MSRPAGQVLPCGRESTALVDLAAEPSSPGELAEHAAACRYCQTELTGLRSDWRLVRRAADLPVHAPAGLVARTLASVRAVRGSAGAPPIAVSQRGGLLSVAGPAVAAMARRVAVEFGEERGGVHVRGVELTEDGLRVLITVRYRTPVVHAAEELRARLRAVLAEHLADQVPPVDVLVVDVH